MLVRSVVLGGPVLGAMQRAVVWAALRLLALSRQSRQQRRPGRGQLDVEQQQTASALC